MKNEKSDYTKLMSTMEIMTIADNLDRIERMSGKPIGSGAGMDVRKRMSIMEAQNAAINIQRIESMRWRNRSAEGPTIVEIVGLVICVGYVILAVVLDLLEKYPELPGLIASGGISLGITAAVHMWRKQMRKKKEGENTGKEGKEGKEGKDPC